MKAAGYLVSPASKLSTRMENGKYHLYCRNACFMIDPHRDTSSVIYNCDRIILIDRHINSITKTSQSFIHRIVYDLVDQVMKTSGRGTSNIHTRPFSYRFQAFQNLDLVGAVLCIHFCTHVIPPVNRPVPGIIAVCQFYVNP